MHRLFVALRPPQPVRVKLLATMDGVEQARWQSDDQLHLTLRFVGEVNGWMADELTDALAGVRVAPFALTVRGAGHFEKKGRSTALWAAIAPSEALTLLQRRIERACRSAGLPPETRRFVPHVTLARLAGNTVGAGDWLARHGDLSAPDWPVSGFILYESTLGKAGADYTLIAKYPL